MWWPILTPTPNKPNLQIAEGQARAVVAGVMEHVEEAGIHSATPPVSPQSRCPNRWWSVFVKRPVHGRTAPCSGIDECSVRGQRW